MKRLRSSPTKRTYDRQEDGLLRGDIEGKLELWAVHFEKLLNSEAMVPSGNFRDENEVPSVHELVIELSEQEIVMVIGNMRNN